MRGASKKVLESVPDAVGSNIFIWNWFEYWLVYYISSYLLCFHPPYSIPTFDFPFGCPLEIQEMELESATAIRNTSLDILHELTFKNTCSDSGFLGYKRAHKEGKKEKSAYKEVIKDMNTLMMVGTIYFCSLQYITYSFFLFPFLFLIILLLGCSSPFLNNQRRSRMKEVGGEGMMRE